MIIEFENGVTCVAEKWLGQTRWHGRPPGSAWHRRSIHADLFMGNAAVAAYSKRMDLSYAMEKADTSWSFRYLVIPGLSRTRTLCGLCDKR